MLTRQIEIFGRGAHSGQDCTLRIVPATVGAGINFRRVDLIGSPAIPATLDSIDSGELQRRTTLRSGIASVSTVEHVLAALYGLGVHDATIEMNAPEAPFVDGSSLPYVRLLENAIEPDSEPAEPIRITRPLCFSWKNVRIAAVPSDDLRITFFFDSDNPLLRRQQAGFLITPETFSREIAPARTFCFFDEIMALRKQGLIQGGSLQNAVVIGRKSVINNDLRYEDEPVRHKVLDLTGDLALLGKPLRGHILAWRSGHAAHAMFGSFLRKELGF